MLLWAKSQNLSPEGFVLRILTKYKEMTSSSIKDFQEEFNKIGAMPVSHNAWDELLQKHVTSDGLVDYVGFSKDSLSLNDYLQTLSDHPPNKEWSVESRLAYWINAYNAFTVKLIIEHMPVNSIKEIAGGIPMVNSPWDIGFFKIGNISFDLNTIEHQILRKTFDEPRIHFAINCASFSCPILANTSYEEQSIYNQLDHQSNLFLKDRNKNQLSTDLFTLSPIFKWYADDFGSKEDIVKFISRYSSMQYNNPEINYTTYDWSLNSLTELH